LVCAHHWLPGRVQVERGTVSDYRRLAHFHYAPGQPAVIAGVWRAVYVVRADPRLRREARDGNCKLQIASVEPAQRDNRKAKTIAVGVLAFPTPCGRARERELHLSGPRYGPKLAFVNRHVRTIARVIVHPQFRSLGVAARLVRRICEDVLLVTSKPSRRWGRCIRFLSAGG
jgi:GNAT superfamily N-acetyltransferase